MEEMSRKTGNVPEETRAALIKAATEEFAEYGFEKSSLRRICARAEVTTGALYSSFANKNDLFEQYGRIAWFRTQCMFFAFQHTIRKHSTFLVRRFKPKACDDNFLTC